MKGRLNHRTYGVKEQGSKDICRALGATGVVTVNDAKSMFGVNSFNELIEKKMIKVLNTVSTGNTESVIHLTEKGRDYTRKHITYGSLYTWNRLQLKHDLALSKVYMGLTREERRSWQNESQLRLFSKGVITGIDGSFVRDGKRIAVEIVTPNYPAAKLSQKIEMINNHFDGMEIRCVQ